VKEIKRGGSLENLWKENDKWEVTISLSFSFGFAKALLFVIF